jgi:hypothetical protein
LLFGHLFLSLKRYLDTPGPLYHSWFRLGIFVPLEAVGDNKRLSVRYMMSQAIMSYDDQASISKASSEFGPEKLRAPVSAPTQLAKIEEVYNTEYEKALAATKLDPLSKRSFQVCDISLSGTFSTFSEGFLALLHRCCGIP